MAENTKDEAPNGGLVAKLRSTLQEKYLAHEDKVNTAWRAMDQNQRVQILKELWDDYMLEDPEDDSNHPIQLLIPEWNLRDLTKPGSDYLLLLLKHRASRTSMQQYNEGVVTSGTRPEDGDYDRIMEMWMNEGLRYPNSETVENIWAVFRDDSQYGEVMDTRTSETLQGQETLLMSGPLLPYAIAYFILLRQQTLLEVMTQIVDHILKLEDAKGQA